MTRTAQKKLRLRLIR